MVDEARLPVPLPHWFLVLRALTRSLLYGLLVLWISLVPAVWPRRWFVLGALLVCWLVLVISLIIEVRHHRRGGQSWRPRVSDALLVLAPIAALVGLPLLAIALVVVGYFIQLRRISAGEIFTFAVLGALMSMVIATMALIEAESRAPDSELTSPFEAGKFAVVQLFSLNGLNPHQPRTNEGLMISFFIQMVGIVLVAAVAAGMLRALVGSPNNPMHSSAGSASTGAADERIERILAQQEEILRRLDRLQPDDHDR